MPETKSEWAASLAATGFRVFPLSAKRLPIWDGWPDKATADVAKIKAFWAKNQRANIGITTGWYESKGAYLVVIDIDVDADKNGFASLLNLEMQHDDLPETYTAKTRRGGQHRYYWSDKRIGNSVSKLGVGIDVRGVRGFVCAPGTVDPEGRAYELIHERPIARLPDWCADLCEEALDRAANADEALVDLDDAGAVHRAALYLENDAPDATEGAGGNITTFQVATRIRDFGVTESTALDLMGGYWNEHKAQPSWDIEELERIIANAYRYGQNQPGSQNPATDFEPFDQAQPFSDGSVVKGFSLPAVTPFEPSSIPRRRWIIPSVALRGKVTVIIAPPGVGKSTLTIALGLSVATDKPFMGMPVAERTRVAMYQNEDDMDELKRRLAAAMQHHGVTFPDLLGPDHQSSLFIESGENRAFTLAVKQGEQLRPQDMQPMIKWLKANQIGLLIIDPFAETHEANENDNGEILKIARWFRQIAQQANCAVILVHHTKKPQGVASDAYVGDMNSGRGAGALMGVARVALTLYPMSKKDAKAHSIPDQDRRYFIRLDDAKTSLSLSGGAPRWFKRVSVPLMTRDIEGAKNLVTGPDGADYAVEEVGALEPVHMQEIQEDDDTDRDILDAIERATADADSTSSRSLLAALAADPTLSHLERRNLTYKANRLLQDESVLSSLMLRLVEIPSSGGRSIRHYEAI